MVRDHRGARGTLPAAPDPDLRPYAFGKPDNVRAHNQGMLAVIAGFEQSADKVRAGHSDVEFPEGTYRPPVMQAA